MKRLVKTIIEKGNKEDMQVLEDVFFDLIDNIHDEDDYKHIERKLIKLVYKDHFSEEKAKEIVSKFENKDGTSGEHWDYETTSSLAKSYNKADWYIVLNMMWSDFYNKRFETDDYISLACDWLDDKDATHEKLLDYFVYIMKNY